MTALKLEVSAQHSVLDRIARRRRRSALASSGRVGSHARRAIRRTLLARAKQAWLVLVASAAFVAALLGGIHLVVPTAVFGYFAGATVASVLWLLYMLLLESSGLAHQRSGILAEEWTASALRGLRRDDWLSAHHIMLEWRDVDHVTIGPGGVFAVETKFRADWAQAESWGQLDPIARVAQDSARQVTNRLRLGSNRARSIVVLWGPAVDDQFPDVFEHDGIVFCPGSRLAGYLRAQPPIMSATEIEAAFGHLDEYVSKRDIGERAKDGLPARTGEQALNDVLAICVAGFALTVLILGAALLTPEGGWSVATGTTFGLAALFTRRRWSHLIRVRLVTTAVITTAVGWAALFGVLLAIEGLS